MRDCITETNRHCGIQRLKKNLAVFRFKKFTKQKVLVPIEFSNAFQKTCLGLVRLGDEWNKTKHLGGKIGDIFKFESNQSFGVWSRINWNTSTCRRLRMNCRNKFVESHLTRARKVLTPGVVGIV